MNSLHVRRTQVQLPSATKDRCVWIPTELQYQCPKLNHTKADEKISSYEEIGSFDHTTSSLVSVRSTIILKYAQTFTPQIKSTILVQHTVGPWSLGNACLIDIDEI